MSWHKQSASEPLFDELLWSKPENKRAAGKLLIAGGNSHEFSDVSKAYSFANAEGAGTIRLALPKTLEKELGRRIPESTFLPVTKSGNIAKHSLGDLLENCGWADALLLPGELGRNSETAIVIEKLISQISIPKVLTKDAVDIIIKVPDLFRGNQSILLVITIAQLQELVRQLGYPSAVKYTTEISQLVSALEDISKRYKFNLLLNHHNMFISASDGEVSTTPSNLSKEDKWRVECASRASVWWMQNSNKPFEAITTSVLSVNGGRGGT